VIAIIAEDKILVWRDQELSAVGEALHLTPPVWVDLRVSVDARGKVVAEGIGGRGFEGRIGLVERGSVDVDATVGDVEPVTGKTDDTLYEQGRLGVMKDDDVSALNGAIWEQPSGERAGWAVDLLVEEEKIADQERVLHALGRNEDGLQNEGEQKEGDDHCAQERSAGFRQRGQVKAQMVEAELVVGGNGRIGAESGVGGAG
jgi:hypothetical protein